MMYLSQYEGKIVRVIDGGGRAFTGVPVAFPADYGFHEFNRDEESVKIEDYQLFESDIAEIKELPNFSIVRATETWQQAGAYYANACILGDVSICNDCTIGAGAIVIRDITEPGVYVGAPAKKANKSS